MEVRVECNTEHPSPKEPSAFFLGERRIDVLSLVDRWFGEDYCYFKIEASDGAVYILRHDENGDAWEMTWFNAYG